MTEKRHESLSVLIVEDQPDTAETLAVLLSLYGHTVRTASCAADAYQDAINHPPEVVLLDIGLPGMNGWELAEWLKTVPNCPVIIATTGFGQQSDYERSSEAGIHLHLVKPVDPELILELFKRHVRTFASQKSSICSNRRDNEGSVDSVGN